MNLSQSNSGIIPGRVVYVPSVLSPKARLFKRLKQSTPQLTPKTSSDDDIQEETPIQSVQSEKNNSLNNNLHYRYVESSDIGTGHSATSQTVENRDRNAEDFCSVNKAAGCTYKVVTSPTSTAESSNTIGGNRSVSNDNRHTLCNSRNSETNWNFTPDSFSDSPSRNMEPVSHYRELTETEPTNEQPISDSYTRIENFNKSNINVKKLKEYLSPTKTHKIDSKICDSQSVTSTSSEVEVNCQPDRDVSFQPDSTVAPDNSGEETDGKEDNKSQEQNPATECNNKTSQGFLQIEPTEIIGCTSSCYQLAAEGSTAKDFSSDEQVTSSSNQKTAEIIQSPIPNDVNSGHNQSREPAKQSEIEQPRIKGKKSHAPDTSPTDMKKQKEYTLTKWCLKPLTNSCICVEGHRRGDAAGMFWHSTAINTRISNRRLMTGTGSIYILVGPMDREETLSHGVPKSIVRTFRHGFPVAWKELWRQAYPDRNAGHVRTVSSSTGTAVGSVNCASIPTDNASVTPTYSTPQSNSVDTTPQVNSIKEKSKNKGTPTQRSNDKKIKKEVNKTHSSELNCSQGDVIDLDALPVTRSGRKVVPSLSFWLGQRILSTPHETILVPRHENCENMIEFIPSPKIKSPSKRHKRSTNREIKRKVRPLVKRKNQSMSSHNLEKQQTSLALKSEYRRLSQTYSSTDDANETDCDIVRTESLAAKALSPQNRSQVVKGDQPENSSPKSNKQFKKTSPQRLSETNNDVSANAMNVTHTKKNITNDKSDHSESDIDTINFIKAIEVKHKSKKVEVEHVASDSKKPVKFFSPRMTRARKRKSEQITTILQQDNEVKVQRHKRSQSCHLQKDKIPAKPVEQQPTKTSQRIRARQEKEKNKQAAKQSVVASREKNTVKAKPQGVGSKISKSGIDSSNSAVDKKMIDEDFLARSINSTPQSKPLNKPKEGVVGSDDNRFSSEECELLFVDPASRINTLCDEDFLSNTVSTEPKKFRDEILDILEAHRSVRKEKRPARTACYNSPPPNRNKRTKDPNLMSPRLNLASVMQSKNHGDKYFLKKALMADVPEDMREKVAKDSPLVTLKAVQSEYQTATTDRNSRIKRIPNRKLGRKKDDRDVSNGSVESRGSAATVHSSTSSINSNEDCNSNENSFLKSLDLKKLKNVVNRVYESNHKDGSVVLTKKSSSRVVSRRSQVPATESISKGNVSDAESVKGKKRAKSMGMVEEMKNTVMGKKGSKSTTKTKAKSKGAAAIKQSKEKKSVKESVNESDVLVDSDISTLGSSSSAWTADEINRLNQAVYDVPANAPNYWSLVSYLVKTRNAEQCRTFHFKDVPNSVAKKKKSTNKPTVTNPAQISGGKGTLKRKRQLRELMENHDKEHEDDFFNATPYRKSKKMKLSVDSGTEEDMFQSAGALYQTPGIKTNSHWMPGSAGKTPLPSFVSPGILNSIDRNDCDRYMNRIKKSRRVYRGDRTILPSTGTQVAPIKVIPTKLSINSALFTVQEVNGQHDNDSEDSDYYFSDNE